MLVTLQILAIAAMILATYAVYRAFGPPRESLLYTAQEKVAWDKLIAARLGTWFTRTNIFATITSLATVYVFFIGNARLFGPWIIVTVVTIFLGGFVTNAFTSRITTQNTRYARLLQSNSEAASVLPTVFWDDTPAGRQTAAIAKYTIIFNILCVLWLEFSVFAALISRLLVTDGLLVSIVIVWGMILTVGYFTLRYGLRGFVFADLFQAPIIVLGSAILLTGSVIWLSAVYDSMPEAASALTTLATPQLPWEVCLAFAIATVFLNGFLMLVTQPHWLRLWAFRERESKEQLPALAVTAVSWTILVAVGLIVGALSSATHGPDKTAYDVVAFFLDSLIGISPIFAVAFWMAGVAVLFSTADSQLYSLLLVKGFDPSTGTLRTERLQRIHPGLASVAAATSFTALYLLVIWREWPFEKLVFLLLPGCMVILPSLIRAYRNKRQSPWFLIGSIFFYLVLAVLALRGEPSDFFFTVAAPLAPVLVGVLAWFLGKANIPSTDVNV